MSDEECGQMPMARGRRTDSSVTTLRITYVPAGLLFWTLGGPAGNNPKRIGGTPPVDPKK